MHVNIKGIFEKCTYFWHDSVRTSDFDVIYIHCKKRKKIGL